MRLTCGVWVGLAVFCASIGVPGAASAFRTLTDEPEFAEAEGQPIGWTRWPIEFEIYEQPADPIGGADTRAALDAAIRVWDRSDCAGGSMEITATAREPARLRDGRNTVQWVHSGWSAIGPNDAVAITENLYQVKVGQYSLVEADIYLNADKSLPEPIDWDADMLAHLDGVLAHELGHALGIAHPCELRGENGAPRCGSVPMSLMHPQYDPRAFTLAADDNDAACWLYPEAAPRAEVDVDSGCSVARAGTPSQPSAVAGAWLMLSALSAAHALRSARRRRARAHSYNGERERVVTGRTGG